MSKSLLLLCLLLATSLAQVCPFCDPNSCTYVSVYDQYNSGLSSCSKCSVGALFNLALDINPANAVAGDWNLQVGICQPCPPACKSCHFGQITSSDGTTYHANVCDECETGYSIGPKTGACTALPANCANATWATTTSMSCQSCQSGYTLSYGQCVYTGTTY